MSLISLIILLVVLILLSAFFSSSETGMMAINRYRLRHLARSGDKTAGRVAKLLERPDRLLGVILLGNTFANIMASAIATVIAVHLFGDEGILAATVLLTLIVLVFAEISPKTLANSYPQKLAFAFSMPLTILLKILYPLVFMVNLISNNFLRLFGYKESRRSHDPMTHDEIRSVVGESTGTLPHERVSMLLGVLDLQRDDVQDIMVISRNIVGIDLDDSVGKIRKQLMHSQYTRVPVYQESIDNIKGVIHVRHALKLFGALKGEMTKSDILSVAEKPLFIPETNSLHQQLINFQKSKQRMAFCVDEYGDIQGLVTIYDILEKVVGDFTTDSADRFTRIKVKKDGTCVISGEVEIRDLNRDLKLNLPTDGPRTLAGLIVDDLQFIPETPLGLELHGLRLEITRIKDNQIKQIKILPGGKSRREL